MRRKAPHQTVQTNQAAEGQAQPPLVNGSLRARGLSIRVNYEVVASGALADGLAR